MPQGFFKNGSPEKIGPGEPGGDKMQTGIF